MSVCVQNSFVYGFCLVFSSLLWVERFFACFLTRLESMALLSMDLLLVRRSKRVSEVLLSVLFLLFPTEQKIPKKLENPENHTFPIITFALSRTLEGNNKLSHEALHGVTWIGNSPFGGLHHFLHVCP